MESKFKYILSGITMIILVAMNYFFLVPLSFNFGGLWWYLIILTLLIGLINTNNTNYNRYNSNKSNGIVFIVISALILILFIILSIFSSTMVNSSKYYSMIDEVKEDVFTNNFDAIDTNQIPIVDRELASQIGDKQLGSIRGLGSEFHVGEFHDLNVNGKLVAVAPLEFNGLFKWLNNKTGTPGYIIIDKVTREVKLIDSIDGKKLNLKYMPSAYFENDLHRHIYKNGHYFNKLIDYALELDDNGYPYWVITKTEKTIGLLGGLDVKSVIVIDPQTGDINEYSVDEAPKWIDTIYPKNLVIKQLNYYGKLKDGFLNSIFAQKDVVMSTDGSRRVFSNGIYHYTGLTSVGSDESTVGIIFINTRTKETKFYSMTGATETAAMQSAEGIVQNFGYRATFPIPLNVYNEPTFLITLKDSKGLIKQYAFVNIEQFEKVGLGDTIDKAYSDYGEKLNVSEFINEEDIEEIIGNVQRIQFITINGESEFYILLEGNETIYKARYSINDYLALTEKGDNVTLRVIGKSVVEFNNNTLK